MAHEIETKVLDIDVKDIKKKLVSLGAKKTQDTRLVVDWYRTKGVKNGMDEWYLRIRSNSEGKHEVTWKAKSVIQGTTRKHKEINFNTTHPEELADLFLQIGLEKYAHQEKDRVSYTHKDWTFDIDHYPHMPAYMEIEGTSEEHVKKAIKLLGIEGKPTWAKGERILIEETYRLDWYNMEFKK
jgi:adenylate cyclase class 2